jgi:GTP 3',8-cyclase
MHPPADSLGRPLRDLRISVTDRCNYRCVYCMPKEVFGRGFEFLPPAQILSYEEIARIARIAVGLGVGKIRITGGEPLVRRDLDRLVEMLAPLDGLHDLTLTTNGALLGENAGALRRAGLRRITVSLDSLDDAVYRRMNDVDYPVSRVVDAIEKAAAAGFSPIKINAVVRRGMNDDSIVALAERYRRPGFVVRFIEYMDVGNTNGWRLDDVVPAREIFERIDAVSPLEPAEPNYRGEVAQRYRYRDGAGEVGIISSVTQPFCGDCTRLRLSAEGRLYACLFASEGFDLRRLVRSGAGDEEIATAIERLWNVRSDRYSEIRTAGTDALAKVEMSRIGG